MRLEYAWDEGDEKQKYFYIHANESHKPIEKFTDMDRHSWQNTIGFFMRRRGKLVELGYGRLEFSNKVHKYLHTESMGLLDKYRNQGHGIHLYFAVIYEAKRLGARRIYSSHSLNKYSGRMWCNKLREYFDVHGPKARKKGNCQCGCRNCKRRWGRYYIDLTKINLKEMPR